MSKQRTINITNISHTELEKFDFDSNTLILVFMNDKYRLRVHLPLFFAPYCTHDIWKALRKAEKRVAEIRNEMSLAEKAQE